MWCPAFGARVDERVGPSELIREHLTDSRGKNKQLSLADLLRQSIYSRMAGYEDVNDCEAAGARSDLPAPGVRKESGSEERR